MKLKTAEEYTGQPIALYAPCEDFRGGKAAQVCHAIAQRAANAHEMLDVAHAVLVADQVRAGVGELGDGLGRITRGAAVVDDDADLHALADRLDVMEQALLRGFGQVVRQQQQALRALALGFLRVLDREIRARARPRR
jgi:hypothetical protein